MGTINRPNSPLTASDGYSEVDANEVVIAAAVNGNLNHENLASEGVRNANIDKDEVFAKETWDNILSDGHFPVWSSGTSSVPDSWTAELTATIARDDAPTYAPSAHYSCKITGAGAAVEGIYQTIELRKNSTYTVNLKVKATAGDTAVIKVVDGDDAEKASQEYTDADWQTDDNKKYFTFTTGTTTNAGEIKIKLLAKVDEDVVWFGESLPLQTINEAFNAVQNCDLMFSIGTSAQIYPAAQLPFEAQSKGAYVIEINLEPTPFSPQANLCIHAAAGSVLPKLYEEFHAQLK